MSDILIKGMEIPDFLPDLTLPYAVTTYNCSIDVLPNGNAHLMFRGKSYSIIEVPTPHGRLIDADALKNQVAQWRDSCRFQDAQVLCTVIDMIHKAPTVIEAEVSE